MDIFVLPGETTRYDFRTFIAAMDATMIEENFGMEDAIDLFRQRVKEVSAEDGDDVQTYELLMQEFESQADRFRAVVEAARAFVARCDRPRN